tara:strand:+ start:5744 stop:6094 length:351 start_codon:yes stop_codon:yes gene_type:complete
MSLEGASYVIAWLLYLIGAVGITVVCWRMTRNIKLRRTRRGLRALIAVILYTPINIGKAGVWLAPAYLVGAYDWILGEVDRAQLAAMFIAAAYGLVILMILLESVLRRLFNMEYGK